MLDNQYVCFFNIPPYPPREGLEPRNPPIVLGPMVAIASGGQDQWLSWPLETTFWPSSKVFGAFQDPMLFWWPKMIPKCFQNWSNMDPKWRPTWIQIGIMFWSCFKIKFWSLFDQIVMKTLIIFWWFFNDNLNKANMCKSSKTIENTVFEGFQCLNDIKKQQETYEDVY